LASEDALLLGSHSLQAWKYPAPPRRTKFEGSVQRGLAIIHGTHNFTTIGRQESTHILKHLLVVVGYQNTDFVHANVRPDQTNETLIARKLLFIRRAVSAGTKVTKSGT